MMRFGEAAGDAPFDDAVVEADGTAVDFEQRHSERTIEMTGVVRVGADGFQLLHRARYGDAVTAGVEAVDIVRDRLEAVELWEELGGQDDTLDDQRLFPECAAADETPDQLVRRDRQRIYLRMRSSS
jgi:hypothetical protein